MEIRYSVPRGGGNFSGFDFVSVTKRLSDFQFLPFNRLRKMSAQPWGAANKPNMNVSWMRDRSAWVIYVLALAGFRYIVSVITFESLSPAAAWNAVHLTHFVVRIDFKCNFGIFIRLPSRSALVTENFCSLCRSPGWCCITTRALPFTPSVKSSRRKHYGSRLMMAKHILQRRSF